MREVTTIVASSPEKAFRLLEDPRSFERLVAGARKAVREAPRSGPIARPGVRRIAEAAPISRNRDICRRYRRIIDGRNREGGTGGA